MGPVLTPDAELAHYPEDVRQLIRETEVTAVERFRHYTEDYSHSERNEAGYVTHYDKAGRIMDQGPLHLYFGLSYASWLVLPRVALQEMPLDWQARFAALLEEAEDRGLTTPEDDIYVTMRGKSGLFRPNGGWDNYRHGNTRQAQADDAARSS